jgi:hypothetical protein
VEKNFKEPTLTALKNKIEAHRAIVNWIDNDMLVLLSQRESMLSDAISRTNNVMNNETDPGLRSIYPFLIAAYNNDRSQFITAFRKTCLTVRTSSEKNAEILTGDYVKISAESLITESQYSSILQNLENAQKNWQTNYDISKYVYSEFTKQANLRNEKYQYMISEIAQLITITSKNEAMQTALNELRAQQVRPINCTITSNNNGFSTEGRISCY